MIMGGRGGGSPASRQAQASTVSIGAPVSLDNRIRGAYAQLAREPGAWVSLTRLRNAMPDVSKSEMDQALLDLFRDSDNVNFVPESNQKTLTQADRDASLWMGGQDKHLMSIFRTT